MSKVDFAKGLKSLRAAEPAAPSPAPEPSGAAAPAGAEAFAGAAETVRAASALQPSRRGKVAISAYFEPEVRKQLALISVHQDMTQAALLAEALNLLFERHGYPPIARA